MGSLMGKQEAIIIGSLLGDGTMRCKANALLEVNHSIKQKAYVDWKYENLRNLTLSPPKVRHGKGNRIAYRFTTRSLPALTHFYRMFYKNGKKIIPVNLKINPLSLAVWFMDDGCKSYRAVYLNTQQFDVESNMRLARLLKKRYDFVVRLNKDKKYYRLRMAVGSVARLRKIIEPYLLPSFKYKIPS